MGRDTGLVDQVPQEGGRGRRCECVRGRCVDGLVCHMAYSWGAVPGNRYTIYPIVHIGKSRIVTVKHQDLAVDGPDVPPDPIGSDPASCPPCDQRPGQGPDGPHVPLYHF